jgi:hypothetical protein
VSCTAATACAAVGYFDNSAGVQMTLVERSKGARWFVQPTPNTSGAASSQLSGVSCTSAAACIAVGNSFYVVTGKMVTGKEVGLAERWNGTSWAYQATPTPTGVKSSSLTAVSCTAPNACTAVGFSDNGTLAERWNGTSWSIQSTPNGARGSSSMFNGVSCTSATACTAVGNVTEQWNGTSWSVQATPAGDSLNGVSCTSATACTAVGAVNNATLVERWDGTSWSVQHSPGGKLFGVSCTSASACTAVGSEEPAGRTVTMVLRWDGTSWSVQATSAGDSLNGVSCTSVSACTAVGAVNNATLAERWDGTRWSAQTTPSPNGALPSRLGAVSCASTNACTAVGFSDGADWPGYLNQDNPAPVVESWNGTSWSVQSTPTPTPPGSLNIYRWSLDAVSCPSANACVAVGSVFYGTQLVTLAEHWDGTQWSIQTTPNPNSRPWTGQGYKTLDAVSCSSATACTAVGEFPNSSGTEVALVERWNGTSWSIQTPPSPTGAQSWGFGGVSCTSETVCTAVGSLRNSAGTYKTLAERWNGSTWSIQTTPSPTAARAAGLYAPSCTSATACTALGQFTNSAGNYVTFAERWNGTSWSIQSIPSLTGAESSQLGSLSCGSATACVAAGFSESTTHIVTTLVEAWNGTAWTIESTPNANGAIASGFNAVSCISADCTAVGFTQVYVYVPFVERFS